MSTRATVYIHWHDDEMDIKLYHHRDGYVDYLWVQLEKALEKRRKGMNQMVKWKNWKAPTLIKCIADIGGFEQAWPIHWDVEYVYHIHYWINDRKAWYDLYCQAWMQYWEDNILARPQTLICSNWDVKKTRKKLNPKQAELDLGNREKFTAEYFKDFLPTNQKWPCQCEYVLTAISRV